MRKRQERFWSAVHGGLVLPPGLVFGSVFVRRCVALSVDVQTADDGGRTRGGGRRVAAPSAYPLRSTHPDGGAGSGGCRGSVCVVSVAPLVVGSRSVEHDRTEGFEVRWSRWRSRSGRVRSWAGLTVGRFGLSFAVPLLMQVEALRAFAVPGGGAVAVVLDGEAVALSFAAFAAAGFA